MKPSTKERAMRALLSSLIGSNLAPNEIREVSDAFQNDPEFCREIGAMINNISVRMDAVKQGQDHRISSIDLQSQDRFVSKMLPVVNKRRLSKRNLRAMIKLLLSESAFSQIEDDLTVAELLAAFKSSASQEQIERFKNWLQPSLDQPESDQVSAALSHIKKKSLSKEEVAAKLSSFLPEIADLIKGDRFSLSEILKIFLKSATSDQIQTMMNFLQSDIPVYGDDYLKGIMKER
jgi:hypothetical protein